MRKRRKYKDRVYTFAILYICSCQFYECLFLNCAQFCLFFLCFSRSASSWLVIVSAIVLLRRRTYTLKHYSTSYSTFTYCKHVTLETRDVVASHINSKQCTMKLRKLTNFGYSTGTRCGWYYISCNINNLIPNLWQN